MKRYTLAEAVRHQLKSGQKKLKFDYLVDMTEEELIDNLIRICSKYPESIVELIKAG